MKTPIYLKMDAKESLLLSEGVCHQLGIISYHPQVTPGDNHSKEKATSDVLLPAVRVQLVEMVKLKPRESIMAGVRFVGKGAGGQGKWSQPEFMLIETNEQQGLEPGAHIASALVKPSADGVVRVLISNSHSLTHKIAEGTEIGGAVPVEIAV